MFLLPSLIYHNCEYLDQVVRVLPQGSSQQTTEAWQCLFFFQLGCNNADMILGVIDICLVMIRKTTFNYFNRMIFNIKAFMCEVRVDHTHLLFSDYPRNKVPFNNYLRLVIKIRSNSVTLSTNLYKYVSIILHHHLILFS